jgi:hypothetical protein
VHTGDFHITANFIDAACRSHLNSATQRDRDLLANCDWTPCIGGRNNGVYSAQIETGRNCFKFYKSDGRLRPQREWASLHFLREREIDCAPEPFYCEEDPIATLIVMEFFPGEHLGQRHLMPMQIEELARAVKAFHRIPYKKDAEWLGQLTARYRVAGVAEFMQKTAATYREQKRCYALWARWLKGPNAQRVHDVGKMVFSRLDTNLSNMLWDGERLRFVDWEYGGWMERLFDLAEQVEHDQSRCTPDAQWAHFIDLCELDRDQLENFRAAQQLVAFEWAAKFWSTVGVASQSKFLRQIERIEQLCSTAVDP